MELSKFNWIYEQQRTAYLHLSNESIKQKYTQFNQKIKKSSLNPQKGKLNYWLS